MLQSHLIRRCAALLTALVALSRPLAQETPLDPTAVGDSVPRTGRLEGQVLDAETGKGVASVTVHAYHLDTGVVFSSQPTDGKGRYRIDGVPLGWLDLYVETSEGLFVANQVVNVPPAEEVDVSLALAKFGDRPSSWAVGKRRDIPGQDVSAIGEARLDSTARGKSFWRKPAGIALIAGGGALIVLAVVSAQNDEPLGSPSSP